MFCIENAHTWYLASMGMIFSANDNIRECLKRINDGLFDFKSIEKHFEKDVHAELE